MILFQGAKRDAGNIANLTRARDKALGQNSRQPAGLSPKSAACRSVEQGPRLRGCDRVGSRKARAWWHAIVPLQGRIQARCAWNLLRPARDALSTRRPYSSYRLSSFAPPPILDTTTHGFHSEMRSDNRRFVQEPYSSTALRHASPSAYLSSEAGNGFGKKVLRISAS